MSVRIIKPIPKDEITRVCEYISQFGVAEIKTKLYSFESKFFEHLGRTTSTEIEFYPSNIAALIELLTKENIQVFDVIITFTSGKGGNLGIMGLSSYELTIHGDDFQLYFPLIDCLRKSEPYSFKINVK
jgi:hypothetical protein